jgi:hypothetical protein
MSRSPLFWVHLSPKGPALLTPSIIVQALQIRNTIVLIGRTAFQAVVLSLLDSGNTEVIRTPNSPEQHQSTNEMKVYV